jgi:hypothetical protein
MTDTATSESDRQSGAAQSSITNVSGSINVDANQVDIGGDVIGRDKIETAGGHIIHAAAGATVIVGSLPDVVSQGLTALHELMQRSPDVQTAVIVFQSNFQAAHQQVDTLADYKDVHDLLHRLQYHCYNGVVQAAARFPGDDLTLDNLTDYQLTLEGIVRELNEVAARSAELKQETAWIAEIKQASTDLRDAILTLDPSLLKRVIWRLNRVLAIQPSRINALLNQQARALRLPSLLSTLSEVSASLAALNLDADRVSQFQDGVAALSQLGDHLTTLVDLHDHWQAVELELRRIEALLDQDPVELEMSWPDLKARVEPLCSDANEEWAVALRKDADALTGLLSEKNPVMIRRAFRSFRRRASDRFFRVDVDLKGVCGELRSVGEPLASILEMIK